MKLVTAFTPQRFETRKSTSVAPRFQSFWPKSRVYAKRTARSGTYSNPSLSAHFASPCAAKYDEAER